MNDLFPEKLVEMRRKQIQEEIDSIRLGEQSLRGKSLLSKFLVSLGAWMVARGERLRAQHSSMTQTRGARHIEKAA
ncbi:MAG: hypothetical protein C4557_11900 [Anaerolineaceae bacterium]|jgi:hypothetical protein|nr:MAG: hypothetical protein C4557_11900 [Anaerolineaceae bacterium]